MSRLSITDINVDAVRLAELCVKYGVVRLEVFGSRARGEVIEGSDLDIMYDLETGRHLGWEIEVLVDELSDLLHAKVDLVSRRALHPLMKTDVEAEARLLYMA